MKKLRILQICHDYEGPFARVCAGVVRASHGHEVVTLFLKGAEDQAVASQVGGTVHFLGDHDTSLRGIKFSSIFKVAALLRGMDTQVVIAHRYKSIYLAGMMSYFFNLPVLIGIVHEHEVFRRPTRRLFVTFWRPQFTICGVSTSVVNNIAKYCPSLRKRGQLHVLGHPVPGQEKDLAESVEARLALGLEAVTSAAGTPDVPRVIGSIGRMVLKKNYELLLHAFALLRQKDVDDLDMLLVMVGDGPLKPHLMAVAKNLGVQDRVHFTGHVEFANQYVKAFDVFVLSSGEEEAFGLVLLEAMLGGVPVISSDAPGPAEVMGDTGRLFRAGDPTSLASILGQVLMLPPEERKLLGQAGYDRATRDFSEAKFEQALWALPCLKDITQSAEQQSVP